MIDLTPKYKTSETASFADVSQKQLQMWLHRKAENDYPVAEGMQGGEGQGSYRLFGFTNIMEFALAGRFIALEIPPAAAFASAAKAAYQSNHTSDDKSLITYRWGGLPYPDEYGDTFVIRTGGTTEVVIGTDGISFGRDMDSAVYKTEIRTNMQRGFVAVNFSRVFRDVCRRMGYEWERELREAYPEYPYIRNMT